MTTFAQYFRLALLVIVVWSTGAHPSPVSAATPRVVYSIGDGVSTTDERYVREGIADAVRYLKETFHAKLKDDLFVNVRDTANPDDPEILAFASGDFLVVFTGGPYWDFMSPALRLQTIIHEFVHVFQQDVIGDSNDASPLWFIEGMAEYVSFDAVQGLGILRPADIYDEETWLTSHQLDRLPDLADLEDIDAFQSEGGRVYSLSYLAVDAMVGNEPIDRLGDYMNLIAGGEEWHDAFAQTFDIETVDFYQTFRTWLVEEMLAPTSQPMPFTLLSKEGIDADVAIVEAPDSANPGEQIVVIAQSDPNANCRFELRDVNDERQDRVQSVADGTGLVYWLITVPKDFSTGNGAFIVDCGNGRDRIEIPFAA